MKYKCLAVVIIFVTIRDDCFLSAIKHKSNKQKIVIKTKQGRTFDSFAPEVIEEEYTGEEDPSSALDSPPKIDQAPKPVPEVDISASLKLPVAQQINTEETVKFSALPKIDVDGTTQSSTPEKSENLDAISQTLEPSNNTDEPLDAETDQPVDTDTEADELIDAKTEHPGQLQTIIHGAPRLMQNKKRPKQHQVSEKLNTFYEHLDTLHVTTFKDEHSQVAPGEGVEVHSDIMDIMFYLLKTRCYVVNGGFAQYLRNLIQVLVNIVVDLPSEDVKPKMAALPVDNPREETQPPPAQVQTTIIPEVAEYEYESEGTTGKKRRKRDTSWGSVGVTMRKCLKIIREITYQLDDRGIPTSWSHWSLPDSITLIASPRDTLVEKVLHLNPIIEGLWQIFLFTAMACNDQLRSENYGADNFVNAFLVSFEPVLKEYWLDDKNYSSFYEDIFKNMNYKKEIQKIKACNYAYQTRNPDFVVPRRLLV